MGMYDTVTFTCPRCEAQLENQSKAGDCTLQRFDQDSVPVVIAEDIREDTVYCETCQRSWTVALLEPITTVRMRLVK